jgi:hypothetical protein
MPVMASKLAYCQWQLEFVAYNDWHHDCAPICAVSRCGGHAGGAGAAGGVPQVVCLVSNATLGFTFPPFFFFFLKGLSSAPCKAARAAASALAFGGERRPQPGLNLGRVGGQRRD